MGSRMNAQFTASVLKNVVGFFSTLTYFFFSTLFFILAFSGRGSFGMRSNKSQKDLATFKSECDDGCGVVWSESVTSDPSTLTQSWWCKICWVTIPDDASVDFDCCLLCHEYWNWNIFFSVLVFYSVGDPSDVFRDPHPHIGNYSYRFT